MNRFLLFSLLITVVVTQVTDGGYWTAVGNMTVARSDLGVSSVGAAIYLTGGCLGPQVCDATTCVCSCASITNTVEVFYPGNKTFARLASMPRDRYRHSTEPLNGLIYVLGGRDLSDALITQVDVYDPVANSWSVSNFSLTNWTSDFSTFVNNGVIWMVGGYTQDYTISPSIATFSPTTGFKYNAIPQMTDPRGDTCSIVFNNAIYVVGGFDPASGANYSIPVSTMEVYDFGTDKWTYGPATPSPGGDKACGVLNSKLHVFGGEGKVTTPTCVYSSPEGDTEEFNFAKNSWSEEVGMDTPRFRFAAEYFGRSGVQSLYVFGGQGPRDTSTNTYPTLSSVEMYTDYQASSASVTGFSLLLLVIVCLF